MTGAKARARAAENGGQPGVRVLGDDPETGQRSRCATAASAPLCSSAKARSRSARRCRRACRRPRSTSRQALRCCRCRARSRSHPETGEPILAGIGRYGPYVQHGKTYANIGKDDDVLEIGGNRAIDLIVAKESGGRLPPRRRRSRPPARRRSGIGKADRGEGRPLRPYVTDGETNATLPRVVTAEAVTLEEAIALLVARRAAGPSKKPARGRKAATKKAPAKKAAAKKTATKKVAAKRRWRR